MKAHTPPITDKMKGRPMNDMSNFLAAAAMIFTASTVLLMLLTQLEITLPARAADPAEDHKAA